MQLVAHFPLFANLMNYRLCVAALGLLAAVAVPSFAVDPPKPLPVVYELRLIRMADTQSPQYVFAVGNSGFSSAEALKRFIPKLPTGSTLRWDPGCKRGGDEPLLSSKAEMDAFAEVCRKAGIRLELVPSG
jgi:hypothetical protein